MIHFQCRCGRRLSVSDDEASGTVTCPSCGESTVVPAALVDVPDLPTSTTGSYDFDEEIAAAAREARPRATKSPDLFVRAETFEATSGAASAAGRTTAERMDAAARRLAATAYVALALFLLAGVCFWIAEPRRLLRIGLCAAAVALGISSFAAMRFAGRVWDSFRDAAKRREEEPLPEEHGSSPSSDGESPPGP